MGNASLRLVVMINFGLTLDLYKEKFFISKNMTTLNILQQSKICLNLLMMPKILMTAARHLFLIVAYSSTVAFFS